VDIDVVSNGGDELFEVLENSTSEPVMSDVAGRSAPPF